MELSVRALIQSQVYYERQTGFDLTEMPINIYTLLGNLLSFLSKELKEPQTNTIQHDIRTADQYAIYSLSAEASG